jgi:hypothetical protein
MKVSNGVQQSMPSWRMVRVGSPHQASGGAFDELADRL